MTEQEFFAEITRVFSLNKLSGMLSKEKSGAFFRLTEFLLAENEKFNLTAITDPAEIILRHYADCATLAARLPKGCKMIDVGCGAGFPTLPVAILRPDVKITAMDATAKRIGFVAEAAKMLGLANVETLVMRAEDGGRVGNLRENFDVATARAVASLPTLAELCLPYVKVGGVFLAMKGKNAANELSDAKRALAILGGRDPKVEEITLLGGDEPQTHPLVSVAKATKTPALYPRPFAQISKKPL